MQFTDTSEKGFQKLIVKHLTETHQFRESSPNDFDKEFCINTEQLFEFIKTTQPESYDMIFAKGERSFLIQLDNRIKERGVIEVLRKGVKHFDKTIDLFFRQPSSNLNPKHIEQFEANIFSVTEELKYTSKKRKSARPDNLSQRHSRYHNGIKKSVIRSNRSTRFKTISGRPRPERQNLYPGSLYGSFCRRYRSGFYDDDFERQKYNLFSI